MGSLSATDLGKLAEERGDKGLQIVGLVTHVANAGGTVGGSQLDTAREIVAAAGADCYEDIHCVQWRHKTAKALRPLHKQIP